MFINIHIDSKIAQLKNKGINIFEAKFIHKIGFIF